MIHRRYAPITYSRSPHNSFTIFRNKKLLFLSGRSQYTPERRRFDPVYKYTYRVGIILHTCLLLYLFFSLIPSFLFLFFFRGDETDPSKHTPSQQWRECGEIDPLYRRSINTSRTQPFFFFFDPRTSFNNDV